MYMNLLKNQMGAGDESDGENVPENWDNPNYLVWRRLQLSKAKLKGVTQLAAMMAGFSMVATVELDFKKDENIYLLTTFAVTTALLVSSAMLSIMIATCILPHIESVAKMNSMDMASQSPHDLLINYIDLSWVLANTVSIFLFILDVILICWIKFPKIPAICITFIMIPALFLLCIFSLTFYRQTLGYQAVMSDRKYDELEEISHRLSVRDGTRRDSRAAVTLMPLNIQVV